MFHITLAARTGDEEHEIVADSGDVYVWEKTHRGKTISQLVENASIVDYYEVAHAAARRQGLFTGTVDEFAETYAIKVDRMVEPDPTQSGALDEPASGSPSNRASRRASGQRRANRQS